MPNERQYAVLGPLPSGAETRAFLGCEVADGVPQRDAPVVVVWLPEELTRDARQVARLQRETTFVTQLHHPNIIRVHGLECFEEGWARVVDYADAEPLSRVLLLAKERDKPLPVRLAARIIADACDGVHHAHEHGLQSIATRPLVHGAIRPDTLLVSFSGATMVTGYGASVLAQAGGEPKKSNAAYMAPEQVIGGKATASPATDNYALGAVLYELLAGKAPYAGAEDVESAIMTGEPEKLVLEGLGARLYEIAAQAMSKRGTERFPNIAAMRAAILAALDDDGLPGPSEVASFVAELIPPEATERAARKAMLDSVSDRDAVTILSMRRPEGVDRALFEASRPGSTTGARSSQPPPRPSQPAPAPRTELAALKQALWDEVTVNQSPDNPLKAAGRERDVTVTDARPLGATLSAPAPIRTAPDRDSTVRTEAPAFAPFEPPQVVTVDGQQARPAAAPPPLAAPPPAPAWSAPPNPAAGLVPQNPAAGLAPNPGAFPPGYVPPGYGPSMGFPPAGAPSMPGMPANWPAGVPMTGPIAVQGFMPGMPGMPLTGPIPTGVPGQTHPTAFPMPLTGPVPTGLPLTGPLPTGVPGLTASWPSMPGAPARPSQGAPQMMSGGVAPAGSPSRPSFAPPPGMFLSTGNIPARQMLEGEDTGRVRTRGSMPPPGSTPGLRPSMAPMRPSMAPIRPSSPGMSGGTGPVRVAMPREESSVTAFRKNAGDSSKATLFIALAVSLAMLIAVFVFGKEPPAGLSEESERHKLPKDLVEMALKTPVEVPELPPEEAPAQPALIAPKPGTAGPEGATGEAPPKDVPKGGTLGLKTEPQVDVYDGNDSLGRTPLTANLTNGVHKLRFTDAKTGINIYKQYRMQPGADLHDTISFGTSQLNVLAPDGSQIFLNGRFIGKAPLDPVTIYEGKYHLKVTSEGKNWTEWFDAPAGQKIEYRVTMKN